MFVMDMPLLPLDVATATATLPTLAQGTMTLFTLQTETPLTVLIETPPPLLELVLLEMLTPLPLPSTEAGQGTTTMPVRQVTTPAGGGQVHASGRHARWSVRC
jgi:hypothetical protein